jgi:hypothetical protein
MNAAIAKDKILILDEADAMIDEFKVVFPAEIKTLGEMGGMVALAHASKVVLLSATFTPYHKDFMFQVMGIPYERQFKFKNTV